MLRIQWMSHCSANPNTASIIQPGLDKLAEYKNFANTTHAYIIATSRFLKLNTLLFTYSIIVLNPMCKLEWFEQFMPEFVATATNIFKNEVCNSLFI